MHVYGQFVYIWGWCWLSSSPLPHIFLRRGLPMNLELTNLTGWPESSPLPTLLALVLQTRASTPMFYMGTEFRASYCQHLTCCTISLTLLWAFACAIISLRWSVHGPQGITTSFRWSVHGPQGTGPLLLFFALARMPFPSLYFLPSLWVYQSPRLAHQSLLMSLPVIRVCSLLLWERCSS